MALHLAAALARRGVQVRLVTARLTASERAELPGDLCVHEAFSLGGQGWWRLTTPLLRLLQLSKALHSGPRADVVLAIQANMAIEVALACLFSRLRLIGCEHNIPARAVRGRLWNFLRPLAYRRLSQVVVLNQGAASALRAQTGFDRIRVIANFIAVPQSSPLMRDDSGPLILAVGRLVRAKGYDLLLDNFAMLLRQCPDVALMILGEGPERPALERQIAALGLGAHVTFAGHVTDVAPFYSRADCLVMTSRWEGMPMVLLEAMARGLVPVTTDFDFGPREIITSGVDGLIVPAGDSAAWCAAVAGLLADGAKRAEMAQAARQITARYGEERIMAQWLDLILEGARAQDLCADAVINLR